MRVGRSEATPTGDSDVHSFSARSNRGNSRGRVKPRKIAFAIDLATVQECGPADDGGGVQG